MLEKIRNNSLLLAKISFSIYNLLIILSLNLLIDPEMAGDLLYIQGVIILSSSISRLGSDYYWLSDEGKIIVISKNELLTLALTGFISVCILKLFITDFNTYHFLYILVPVYLLNFIAFMARVYQKNEMHVKSLFMQLLAPTMLTFPIFIVGKVEPLIAINISLLLVVISTLLVFDNPKNIYKYESSKFLKRVSYFPMIVYGVINQNFISVVSGALSKEELAPLLVLFQRVSGLITWPQIFFMQKNIASILLSAKTLRRFDKYLIFYLKRNIVPVSFYSLIVMLSLCAYLIVYDLLLIDPIISLIIIILSTIINASFTHLQLISGKEGKSKGVFLILILFPLCVIWVGIYVNTNMVTISLFYFFFQILIHLSNIYILRKHIRNTNHA